jgi:PAT family acetyl-CoA transporter-like MFS transporter 1
MTVSTYPSPSGPIESNTQLLNTISNLGGTLPKPFILQGVDYLSSGYCSIQGVSGNCAMDPGKDMCEDAGGHCIIQRDGYYIMSFVCVIIGATLLLTYILPTVRKLQGE